MTSSELRIPAKRLDILLPPGKILAEELKARGMTQAELARRMDRPAQAISEIIRAKKAITAETAIALERVFGISATMWLRLEARYREILARQVADSKLHAELARERVPATVYDLLSEMADLPRSPTDVERLRGLVSFFGVASPALVRKVYASAFADVPPSRGWIRATVQRYQELQQADLPHRRVNRKKLASLLPKGYELPPSLTPR